MAVRSNERNFSFLQCVDLKFQLDIQKVQAKESSDEKEDLNRETKRKQQHLEVQVSKLQKDLETA